MSTSSSARSARAPSQLTEEVMHFADRVSSGSSAASASRFCLDPDRHDQEGRGQFQFPVARAASAQLRATASRISRPASWWGRFCSWRSSALTRAALQSTPVQLAAAAAAHGRLLHLGIRSHPTSSRPILQLCIYLFTPNTRVRLVPALIGAAAAGVLWAAVGKLFTAFVVYSTRLADRLRGIRRRRHRFHVDVFRLADSARRALSLRSTSRIRNTCVTADGAACRAVEVEQLALKMMYLVAAATRPAAKRWTADDLAAELGLAGYRPSLR